MPKRNQQYQQFTEGQRYLIQVLPSTGFSQCKLADNVKLHCSTVSRELKRNIKLLWLGSPRIGKVPKTARKYT